MSSHPDDGDAGTSPKTLIRIIIIVGIGIPILIEGATFVSLIGNQLAAGGEAGEPTAPTITGEGRVGVGDDLLPETAPNETVTDATLVAAEGEWTFSYAVAVDNPGDRSYRLELRSVRTESDRTVEGTHSTTVAAGESATLRAEWSLPEGERPDAIRVVAITAGGEDGTETTVRRTVPIEGVPVRGR